MSHLHILIAALIVDALAALALLGAFAVRDGRAIINACGVIGLLELATGLVSGWLPFTVGAAVTLAAWAYGRFR